MTDRSPADDQVSFPRFGDVLIVWNPNTAEVQIEEAETKRDKFGIAIGGGVKAKGIALADRMTNMTDP